MSSTFGHAAAPWQSRRARRQASGERFHHVATAILQAKTLHRSHHPVPQSAAAEAVQMPLRPQILLDGERLVQALRLEHDAYLAAHRSRIAFHVAARDHRLAIGRDHHGRENPEQRGFSPAIGSE